MSFRHKEFDDALDHYHYANSLALSGEYAAAIWHFDRAFSREWECLDCEVFVFASWLLATCPDAALRDPFRAIELATEACSITDWLEFWPIGALAAAHAANGEFELAIEHQSRVIELLAMDSFVDESVRADQVRRLELYKSEDLPSYDSEPGLVL